MLCENERGMHDFQFTKERSTTAELFYYESHISVEQLVHFLHLHILFTYIYFIENGALLLNYVFHFLVRWHLGEYLVADGFRPRYCLNTY